MTSSDDKGADVGPVFEATLMRFVDGDLPPREHAFVARLIAVHPDASRSVLAYRFTNDELRGAYDVAMNVPDELINRCLPATDRPSLRSRPPGWRPTLLALAASIALLLAGAAGWVLREATHSEVAASLGIAPPGLQRVLETTLAGNVAQLSGALSAKLVATFPSRERRWCRQYALSEGQQERARGVACRQGDGWHIVVQAASRQATTAGGAHEFWVPAGGNDPVASYANEIMGNTALGPEDEEQLIKNEHWKRAP
jgi:hypothetical protein